MDKQNNQSSKNRNLEQNIAPLMLFLFALIMGVLGIENNVEAATYYVDGSVSDDSGDGSEESPKKYIQSGLDLLDEAGGDELIIANGTYTTSQDRIDYTHVPSGISYTTIKAETDWGVTINYPFILGDDHHATNYIKIQGIKFVSPGGTVGGSAYTGHHAKFIKCAFVNSLSSKYGANLGIGTKYNSTEYVLVEDCYAYGLGGRYKFITQTASKVVFRRCVARSDGGWVNDGTANPEAVFMTYNSEDVLWQNCIAIDSDLTYDYWHGAFYVANKGSDDFPIKLNRITWEGCIAINVRGHGLHLDLDFPATDLTLKNTAFLYKENPGPGIMSYKNSADLTIENITVLNAWRGLYETGSGGALNAANFIVVDSEDSNIYGNIITNNYFSSYRNGQVVDGASFLLSPYSSGLTYPPRIEDNSPLKTAGENQTQLGAEITKQIGVSGTIFGDLGYDTITDTELFPFPNENNIKEDMSEDSARGFCADGTGLYGGRITLTSCIWEYLGNPCPVDVCNYYDVNRDGEVNVQDVQAVANVILGSTTNDNADTTGDGDVNVQDIQGIVNVILH